MNIRDVMTPNPSCVSPEDSFRTPRASCATWIRARSRLSRRTPVGIVTTATSWSVGVAEDGQLNRPVRDIVTGSVVCASPDMSTREAADLMSEHQVRRLPVVENERLVGIVSIGDLAVKEGKDKRMGDTLQDISAGVKERG